MSTSTLPAPPVSEATPSSLPGVIDSYFSALDSGPPVPWNLATVGGLLALVMIWAAWFHGTWACWGNLTIDCGREMYVPSALLKGKTLYRDIWYLYGPLAPYWNSFLYRLFGVQLNVLYWAGSLSAIGCAVFLYHTGMRLSAPLAGWTAGAAVLFQAFHSSLFSFPLPYSSAAVYGYLVSCVFLWLVIHAATSRNRAWIFGAGTAAAVALLLKLEVGAACYVALMILIAARTFQQRSWKSAVRDIAACLPGLLVCAIVILWMISLGGVQFITQENLTSWPGTFFMRTYGKSWLATTGFSISGPALAGAAKRLLVFLALVQGAYLPVSRKRPERRTILLRAALFFLALAYISVSLNGFQMLSTVFFPQELVLYVSVAALAAWWHFLRQPESDRGLAIALLLTFSSLYAFRILLKTFAVDYPVYYNGPAILCFLLLLRSLMASSGRSRRFILLAESLVCCACLAVPAIQSRTAASAALRPAWLTTEHGSIRVPNQTAENYRAAIQFMKEKNARGESVLSVPEDVGLYFLSGTFCPTRVCSFTPGILAPGKMTDELIQQIEQKQVRYLIWSNRLFPEYAALRFGVDYDQTVGNYLFSHYRRVAPLTPAKQSFRFWSAFVWERIPEREVR
jgi:hypothetical protein